MSRYSFPVVADPRSTMIQWATSLRKLFDENLIAKPESFIPAFQATAGGTISASSYKDCYKQVENDKLHFSVNFTLTWSVAGPEVKVIFPFNELNNLTTSGHGGVLYSAGATVPTGLLGYCPVNNNGLFIRRYDNSNFTAAAHDYFMTGFYFFK